MNTKDFGKLIRKKLKEKNMTQAKLAEKLNVSKMQVSHYLNGQNDIPYQNMVKICSLLNLNLNAFYGIYDAKVSDREMMLIELCRDLSEEEMKEVISFATYLKYRRKKS